MVLDTQTFLQCIVEQEVNNFVQQNKVQSISIPVPLDIEYTGSLITEVNSSGKAFQKLVSEDFLKKAAQYVRRPTDVYRQQLGTNIITVEKVNTIREAIMTLGVTIDKIGNRFAGAIILTQHGSLINPFHPLVALELLVYPNIEVKKLYIFTYTEDTDSIFVKYDQGAIIEEQKEDIKLLIRAYQSRITHRELKIVKNTYDKERKVLEREYRVAKHTGEDLNKEYYLVAHQLLTKGTFVPYYGTSIIQLTSNSSSGYHITPFKSCNLNNHSEYTPVNVCTGSKSNRTIAGLRTLHHANLSSPYESHCMTSHSKTYADACIAVTIDIYKSANFILKTEVEENNQDEPIKINDTSTVTPPNTDRITENI